MHQHQQRSAIAQLLAAAIALDRPPVSSRGVVIVFQDFAFSTLPSISARSHFIRSSGVDQMPPAAPIQPRPSGIDGSAGPRPIGV